MHSGDDGLSAEKPTNRSPTCEMHRYRKKATSYVVAVRLDLDTPGFVYRKWGGEQFCKPGDWIVDNAGEIYTVDTETFAQTYRQQSPGVYMKVSIVWARIALVAGTVETKEGVSHYECGDFIVYNDEARNDGYCVSAAKFASMYELDK